MVSIIVPVYNIEKYLSRCVESLREQTYKEIQILLVDDGSTDGSGALCDAFAAEDPRIQVIHKPNGGLSDARNAGLDAATGEWILFVDGDDYLSADGVQRLLDAAQPDADFVQFHYFETEDIAWGPDPNQPSNPVICEELPKMWQWLYDQGGVAASSCTKLWNRRVFDGVRFKKGILHEDEELMNRVLPHCSKVVYTDLVLYGYVMRSGSIVHSGFKPKSMDVLTIMDDRIQALDGLETLILETKKRQFQTAVWQYCLARRGGFKKEAGQLKSRILALSREEIPLEGQYRLVHKMTKRFGISLDLYYLIRRVSGKT